MLLIDSIIILFLFASIIFNGFYVGRTIFKNNMDMEIIDAFILGVWLLIFIEFLASLLDANLSVILIYIYCLSGTLLGIIWLKEKIAKKEEIRGVELIKHRPVYLILLILILSTLIVQFSFMIFYQKMNWDGMVFYLKDANLILRSDSAFDRFGQGITYFQYPNFATSFTLSTVYAYFGEFIHFQGETSLEKLIFYNQTFGILSSALLVIFLLSVYRLGSKILTNNLAALVLVLVILFTPAFYEYLEYKNLATDLLFLVLIANISYYSINFKDSITKNSMFLAILIFLVTLTKINGLYLALMIIVVFGIPQLKIEPRKKELLAIAGTILIILFFIVFNTIIPKGELFRGSYFGEPINLCIIVISVCIFIYTFLTNQSSPSSFDLNELLNLVRNKKAAAVIVIALLLTMIVPMVYLIKTGSPFLYYIPNIVGNEKEVLNNLNLAQGETGDWGRIESYFYGIFGEGYEFGPIFILLLLYLKFGVKDRPEHIKAIITCMFLLFLVWIFIFHAQTVRHILPIILFIGVYVVFIIFSLFKDNNGVLLSLIILITYLPLIISVLYVPTGSSIVNSFLNSHWNWAIKQNILVYFGYLGGATLSIFILMNYIIPQLSEDSIKIWINILSVIIILFNLVTIGVFWSNPQFTEYSFATTNYGYLYALDFMNKEIPENGVLIFYKGFGVEIFTDYRYKYLDMLDFRDVARINSLNCSEDIYHIAPTKLNEYYEVYANVIEKVGMKKYLDGSTQIYTTKDGYWNVNKLNMSCNNSN
ncbi:Uncharacterised protein [Candidatus Bilamarchaeum dharawalense]|uniref:Uncharacterized protein n=1 Tax=Candidatus Bilamarchaeum dharawalense TaxID=2885759 RepID=A0A5E4LRD1_9ARCH|nr:Uncharacterised protein [Candidatus Bilamarchaeum dharawalense]